MPRGGGVELLVYVDKICRRVDSEKKKKGLFGFAIKKKKRKGEG